MLERAVLLADGDLQAGDLQFDRTLSGGAAGEIPRSEVDQAAG